MIAALAAAWLLAPLPVNAGVQELSIVAVGVDSRSLGADEKAFDYGKKRAVYLAARKLGVKDPAKVVSQFTKAQYDEIIRGAEVVQSRRDGDVTYSEVRVSIVTTALRRNLKLPPEEETDVSNLPMRGVLVLSVYVGPDRPYLWEKENELKAALADEVRRQSRAGVLLPTGDLQDLRLIDYQNALTVKPEEMKPMFERYGAEEIVIAVMKPAPAGTATPANVLLRRLRTDNTVRTETFDVTPDTPEESASTRIQKTATAIASAITQIASATAEQELAQRAKAKQIKVRFSYAIPKDLARMEEAVRHAPEVLYLDLPSIALARIAGTIYLKGDEEALRQTLTKQGIIVRSINEGWQLSTR